MTELEKLSMASAADVGRSLADGRVSAIDVTEHFLAAIGAHDDPNVFLTVTAERARAEAAASTERYQAGTPIGPLDGVPTVWKDLLDVADTVTTAGSDLFRDEAPADGDAEVVRNSRAAGMITLGKVTMPEFAFSALGQNPHYGTPVNPLDGSTRRATGGSSSGTGAAVAAGLAPCGLGSDTNGSVRIPAAFCGLVGFKTTEKRISTDRTFVLSHTLDTLGPIARTVEDCALLDAVWRGAEPQVPIPTSLTDLKIIVPNDESSVFADAESAVVGNFHTALEALRSAGTTVDIQPMPLFEEIRRLNEETGTLLAAESYFNLKQILDGTALDRVDPRVAERALLGRELSVADLLTVQTERERLIAAFAHHLHGKSCVAIPTTAISAPDWEPLEADVGAFRIATALANKNTMLGSFLRTCAIALPSGGNATGMPTSLMLMAPGGSDEDLLSQAAAVETVLASS